MKKRLIVLVALMLCVVTVLAACTSSMKLKKVVGDGTYNDENPAFTTAAKLDVKGEITRSEGDLVVFEDENDDGFKVTTVYNVATGAVVYTATDSGEVKVEESYTLVRNMAHPTEQWGTTLLSVVTMRNIATYADGEFDYDQQMDVKMMTATGVEILSITDVKEAQMMNSWTAEDLFCVDNKVYRIADDGSVAFAFDWNDFREIPEEYDSYEDEYVPAIEKIGDFYVNESYNGINIYDSELNLVVTFNAPSYANRIGFPDERMYDDDDYNFNFNYLSNGNVLIQYAVEQDWMTDDYDYIEYGSKYNLYSFLVDAEKGKVKDLDLDYVVFDTWYDEPGDDDWFYNEKVENFAWIIYLEDERLDMSETAAKAVSLGNNGKIDGVIDELIPNMAPMVPELVANNRWIVYNLADQAFLLNEKGDVIGEVSNLDWSEMTPDFLVMNGRIYDWDLNVKVDLAEQKCEGEYLVLDHSVLFATEDEEIKIYANGEVKTLIDKATAEEGDREIYVPEYCTSMFVIMDTATEDTVKIEVYNSVGTKLDITIVNVEFDSDCVECYADSNNALLISGINEEGEYVYYRVG